MAFAVEQANSQINTGNPAYGSGANTVNRLPDFTAHLRYEDKKLGHIQLSGIYRYLAFDNDNDGQGVSGWDVSLSGEINLFAHDALTFEGAYGEGIARYIQDPSGQNEDAALDSHGNLRAQPEAEPIDEVVAQCEPSGAVHSGHFFALARFGNCHREFRGLLSH